MKAITYFEICTAYNVSLNESLSKEFNFSTNVVSSLFDRCLNWTIEGLRKYRIDLHDQRDVFKVHLSDSYTKIAHCHKTFDFNNYFKQSKLKRREIILETLYEAIKNLCKIAGYELKPFTIAYNKVKELNYENIYSLNKPTASRNRKQKAGIQIKFTDESACISVVFYEYKANDESKCIEIFKTYPHHHFIPQIAHKGKWTQPNVYTISDKSQQINFDVSFTDNTSQLRLEPKTATIEELKKTLKSIAL